MEANAIKEQKIISCLSFTIREEHYAINASKIIHILEFPKITKVPKLPDFISGVIHLLGEVLPIIDTSSKLGLGVTQLTANTCILILETEIRQKNVRLGALVDSVEEILAFEDEEILPPPPISKNYGLYKYYQNDTYSK